MSPTRVRSISCRTPAAASALRGPSELSVCGKGERRRRADGELRDARVDGAGLGVVAGAGG
jgi:hypothetical protein